MKTDGVSSVAGGAEKLWLLVDCDILARQLQKAQVPARHLTFVGHWTWHGATCNGDR